MTRKTLFMEEAQQDIEKEGPIQTEEALILPIQNDEPQKDTDPQNNDENLDQSQTQDHVEVKNEEDNDKEEEIEKKENKIESNEKEPIQQSEDMHEDANLENKPPEKGEQKDSSLNNVKESDKDIEIMEQNVDTINIETKATNLEQEEPATEQEKADERLPEVQPKEENKEEDKIDHTNQSPIENNNKLIESPIKKTENKVPAKPELKQPGKPQKPITKKPAITKPKFDKYSSIDDRIAEGPPQKDFDEIPVGTGAGTFQISEYPEGMNPFPDDQAEPPQDTGPLVTRVKSKVWKVRQTAFEELANKFLEADASDPIFEEYNSDLEKFIADSNPGAQEKALEVLRAYLQKKGAAGLDANTTTKALIDKALGPAKPNIKTLSYEIFCLMFEKMDKQGIFEGIIDSINQKNQKTIIASIQALGELLKNYGPKRLDFLKPFFPHIEKVAGSTVSSLRGETMNFYKEAYRFMGDALKPFITKLKKAQVDELEKFFAECPKELVQPLKAEEIKAPTKEGQLGKSGNKEGTKSTAGGEGFDPYDIADPVDIFKKYNEKWCQKVLGLDKWNEKKTVLEEFLKEVEQTPKIASVPFQHITSMLKKLLNDNNFPIVFATVKIYGALAKGLRKHFHGQCKIILPFILEKLKDKRSALIEETTKTLDNFLYCVALDEIIEDLKEGLSQKSPNMRITLLSWIDKYFEKHSENSEKLVNLFKSLLPVLKKLVDDSSNDVREAAIKTLAKQKAILGAEIIGNSFDDLNPSRLSKINNTVSTLTGIPIAGLEESTKTDISITSPTAKGRTKTPGSFAHILEEEKSPINAGSASKTIKSGQKVINTRPTSSVNKKVENEGKKSVTGKEGSRVQNTKTTFENDVESFQIHIAEEDVEFKLAELGLPEKINHSLNDANWKEKQKGITEYSQWIADNTEAVNDCMEYIYQFLKTKMKDWKESNPNVLKEAFQLLVNTSSNQSILHNKKSINVILPFILANIHESKYTQICHSIICSLIESVHPRFVITSLISASQETKAAKPNPKILVEVCNILTKLIHDLPLSLFPLKETIEFGKIVLSGQLPVSKTAAINLFKAMYQQIGPQLNDFLTDVSPAILKTLQTEFGKIQPNKEVECKIQFRGDAEKETKIELSKSSDPLESLPRVDISKDAEKIIKKLNDNDWKVKQEGLDALDNLLATTGNRISANGLHNLAMTLKQRLNDHNKNQVKNFIIFVGKFIYALGPEGKSHAKILLPEIVKNLSDKQSVIRAETVKTADRFGDAIGQETVINSLLPLLTSESPELRNEVLNWILKNQESLPKADVKGNVGPVLAALQDKTKDIRLLAERLLEKCIEVITVEPYKHVIKDMKPAVQDVLKPVLNKITGEEDIPSVDISIDKSRTIEQPRTMKKNPSDSNIPTQKQIRTKPRLNNAMSLKTEGDEPREHLKKASLNQSGNFAVNLSSGSLNNSMSSNAEATYPKSIIATGEKSKRQEEDRKTKWPTEEVRQDLVIKLKDHLKKCISKDLFTKMFATDSKKYVEAVRILNKALIVEFQETVEILDLILRWFFARLWDNVNTQMMKESLDYFFSLTMSLEAAKYTLFDFETNVLVPCLVNRLGTGPSNLKISLHKIFPKLGGICPPQKIAGFLVDAMKSRSHKTKIESIEVLAEMVKAYGPDIISQKDLKMYGKLLGDFDVNIKANALKLMTEVGHYMGEELLNITGNDIPPKLHEIIQQKRFSNEENEESQGEGDVENTDHDVFHKIKIELEPQFDEIQEVDEEQGMYASQYKTRKPKVEVVVNEENIIYESPPKIEKFDSVVEEEEESQEKIQSPVANPLDEAMEGEEEIKNELNNVVLLGEKVEEKLFEKCIELLKKGSVAGKLDALLFIQDIITSENQENKDFLEANAGLLLEALQVVLTLLLSRPSSQVPIKFLLYFLDVVHKLVTIKSFLKVKSFEKSLLKIMKGVSEESLQSFFEALFHNLLEQNEKSQLETKESPSIVRVLNSITLRLLENSDPNKNIASLYALLSKYQKNLEDQRVIGLSLKCILKLANAFRPLVSSLKPEKILLELHKFLLLQTEESDELPIESVKIILQQLINLYGQRIQHHYSQGVEKHPSKDKYLKDWITTLLRVKADKDWTPVPISQSDEEDEEEGFIVENGGSEEVHTRIKDLIESLKKTADFKMVIEQLYKELHNNQDVNIKPFLENEKDSFKWYVSAALEKLHYEKNVPGIKKPQDKVPYNIKPAQISGKENQEGSLVGEIEHQRVLLNTLKIRFALITKNSNVEIDQLIQDKIEEKTITSVEKKSASPEPKETQNNKSEKSSPIKEEKMLQEPDFLKEEEEKEKNVEQNKAVNLNETKEGDSKVTNDKEIIHETQTDVEKDKQKEEVNKPKEEKEEKEAVQAVEENLEAERDNKNEEEKTELNKTEIEEKEETKVEKTEKVDEEGVKKDKPEVSEKETEQAIQVEEEKEENADKIENLAQQKDDFEKEEFEKEEEPRDVVAGNDNAQNQGKETGEQEKIEEANKEEVKEGSEVKNVEENEDKISEKVRNEEKEGPLKVEEANQILEEAQSDDSVDIL